MSYKVIRIPKSSGGFRVLHAPDKDLKAEQRNLLRQLMDLAIPPGPYLHAYCRRRSIATAAHSLMFHDPETNTVRPPHCILKMDVKDFFPSCTAEEVGRGMERAGVPEFLRSEVLAKCFIEEDGKKILPQGAPTSPFLSNLVMRMIAIRIAGALKKWNRFHLSRVKFAVYCDNITFVSDSPKMLGLMRLVRAIFKDHGLELNEGKYEFHKRPAAQIVCGVQLNADKIGPRRNYWRSLRADICGAIIDLKAGLTKPGFYLGHKTRNEIKAAAEISGSGIVEKKALPKKAKGILKRAKPEPIPFEEWRGKISFVRSLDPAKADSLAKKLDELEGLCRRKKSPKGSKSVPTAP